MVLMKIFNTILSLTLSLHHKRIIHENLWSYKLAIQPVLHDVFLNKAFVVFPKKRFQNVFKHNRE